MKGVESCCDEQDVAAGAGADSDDACTFLRRADLQEVGDKGKLQRVRSSK